MGYRPDDTRSDGKGRGLAPKAVDSIAMTTSLSTVATWPVATIGTQQTHEHLKIGHIRNVTPSSLHFVAFSADRASMSADRGAIASDSHDIDAR